MVPGVESTIIRAISMGINSTFPFASFPFIYNTRLFWGKAGFDFFFSECWVPIRELRKRVSNKGKGKLL